MIVFLIALVPGMLASASPLGDSSGNPAPASPTNLRCEFRENPLGIETTEPRLSWWMQCTTRGDRQTAYQVAVASTPAKLKSGDFDLWNTGKTASANSHLVPYRGKRLASEARAFWKVRTWDAANRASEWSTPASWSMGLLRDEDWSGRWIGATERHSVQGRSTLFGYHALEARSQDQKKWVQVDLGEAKEIDAVRLYHPFPAGFDRDEPFGFPLRFRIEVSDREDMTASKVLHAESDADFEAKTTGPKEFAAPFPIRGRFVRVTATKLWNRRTGAEPFCFALAELEVLGEGKNLALRRPVKAFDSVENDLWAAVRLTDGTATLPGKSSDSNDPENAAVMLRKPFRVDRRVVRATATLCGLGYSELMVNGQKVGDHVLDPGFTDFDRRALYLTYDVTSHIRRGDNAIGILLGGGWYNLAVPDLFGFEKAPWSASPRARLHLRLEFADGTSQTIGTDATWKWSTGEITFNGVRGGETIDARRAQHGWSLPRFSDSRWNSVRLLEAPKGKLVSQAHPPIRAHKAIHPISLSQPKPGVWLFDLGVNIAGWAKMTLRGKAGTKVTLEYNEKLNPDGTLDTRHLTSHTYGRFQRDEFILAGTGIETFEPRFTYHGFRYVQVTGLPEPPTLDSLVGKWVTTDFESRGRFRSSDSRIQALHEVTRRTILNNMHGIPTDCPQREKMGWMADGQVVMEAAIMNFDAPNFYRKWIADMEDSQDPNGHVPDIVPTSGWGKSEANGAPGNMADPWWGGAIVVAPWKLYAYYGDKRVLAESYPAMKAYVDYLTSTAKGHQIEWGLGDWLDDSAGGGGRRVPVVQTSTTAYYYTAKIVSETAQLLGYRLDARHYGDLAANIQREFNAKYLRADGSYNDDSQTGQAMPLVTGIVPADRVREVADGLVRSVEGKRNRHISAGIVGALYVFQALAESGRDDLAWAMLKQEDYPGWLHMLNRGATSLWEDWKGENSFNHPTLGSVDYWLYQSLGGIRPDPSAPGFKRFTVQPYMPDDLDWVDCAYTSPYGEIRSKWKQNKSRRTLEVVVPANTTAKIVIPTSAPAAVRESGRKLAIGNGIASVSSGPGTVTVEVGSGTYRFEATR